MKSKIATFIFILFFTVLASTQLCFSQTDTTPDNQQNKNEDSSDLLDLDTNEDGSEEEFLPDNLGPNNNFFLMIFLLFIFIVALYLVIRWVSKKRNITFTNSDFAKVEGTKALALNKYIQLVKIGEKYYLLGIGDHSVNLIKEISDKEEIDTIKLSVSKTKPSTQSFLTQFSESFKNVLGLNSNKKEKFKKSLNEEIQKKTMKKPIENEDEEKFIFDEKQYEKNIEEYQKNETNGIEENNDTKQGDEFEERLKRILEKNPDLEEKNEIISSSSKGNSKKDYRNQDNSEKDTKINRFAYEKNVYDNNAGNSKKSTGYEKRFTKDKQANSKNDKEIIDESNFDFIKKQRERLANLGIDVENKE